MLRLKAIAGVVPMLLVAVLIGCGGDSKDDASSKAETKAADSAEVKKLLEETFGPNDKATSGKISGTIDLVVKGARRYREPIQVTVSGPFSQSGSSPTEANLSVGLQLRGGGIGGELVLIDDDVLIGLGTTGYKIPGDIASIIRKPLAETDNGLASLLKVFGIDPQRWAKNPRIVGNEDVNGEETIHGTAQIDTQRFFLDVARLGKVLTKLRITEVTGLPREITRRQRVALGRSVEQASGDVWTGAEDKVLRKAAFDMRLKPSARDRKLLGFTSLTAKGELTVTDVGTDQRIERPPQVGSYSALQITLDALAESVR
jgi:hypothetical protein